MPTSPQFPHRDFEPEPTVTEDGYGGIETRYGTVEAPHRLLGPAIVTTFSDGGRKEEWFLYGERHRINGPAEIERSSSGTPEYETYWREGKFHRIDGPAHIEYAPDGSIVRANFYVFGFDAPNGIGKALEGFSPESVRLAIEDSPFGRLLDEEITPEQIVGAISVGVRTAEGVREVLGGSPAEWVVAYEEGNRAS